MEHDLVSCNFHYVNSLGLNFWEQKNWCRRASWQVLTARKQIAYFGSGLENCRICDEICDVFVCLSKYITKTEPLTSHTACFIFEMWLRLLWLSTITHFNYIQYNNKDANDIVNYTGLAKIYNKWAYIPNTQITIYTSFAVHRIN